ncbi:hypothetical protein VSR34_16840 [Paraburkholderia sp. JHI2823]
MSKRSGARAIAVGLNYAHGCGVDMPARLGIPRRPERFDVAKVG